MANDYERDEALRDALKLVGRRRETVEFWDGFHSDGCSMLYRVSRYLHNELTKVFGGVS